MTVDVSGSGESHRVAEALTEDRAGVPFGFVNARLLTRHIKRAEVISGLVCAVLFVAAILAFPEMGDGYLLLALHEHGPDALLHAHLPGRLAGWLLFGLAEVSSIYFWPIAILLNSIFWFLFGTVSCRLWVHLFPSESGYAPLVACLTIAPVVLEIQTTTFATGISVLACILGYLSLLLMLDHIEGGGVWRYRLSMLLIPLAILLAPDSVAISLVSLVLLRSKSLATPDISRTQLARKMFFRIAALSVLSYVVCLFVFPGPGDLSDINSHASWVTKFASLPLAVVTQGWHATIGAYGSILGDFSLSWSLCPAILLAVLFSWILTSRITETVSSNPHRLVSVRRLVVALLLPLSYLALRHSPFVLPALPREAASATQFLLPIIPIAAMLTSLALLSLVRLPLRPVSLAILGLFIGFTLFTYSWSGFRRQQMLSGIGSAMKPYVTAADANILAVLSADDLCVADYSCTAKAAAHWSGDLAKRFWLYKPGEGLASLGSRRECKSNAQVTAGTSPVLRSGPVSRLLWVQISGSSFSIEPYCLADTGARTGPAHSTVLLTKTAKGLLTASFSKPTMTQDFTALGTADWAYWTSAATVNHKSSGGKQIFYYNTVGGTVRDYAGHPFAFEWTDGAPTLSESNARTGISMTGMGHGFQIAAPADATRRTFSVYIGAHNTPAKIQAHISDGSTPDYTDNSINGEDKAAGMYTFTYRAGSTNQLLIVTYTQTSRNPQASISLQGATLVVDDR